MDGIIDQLNKTKKMFIIMILSIMIIPPISFVVTFALFGPPFPFDNAATHERFGHRFGPGFVLARCSAISNFFNMVRNRDKTVVCTFKVDQEV